MNFWQRPRLLFAFLFVGPNVITGTPEKITLGKEGAVVVFLSAKCPCSNSHIEELARLSKENPKVQFVAVHSNADESLEEAKSYFASKKLPFPVVEDVDGKLAEQFKALKTPHAFLLNSTGKTIYAGGVSNSADSSQASQRPLRAALDDVKAGKEVQTPTARTLGCVIKRRKT